MQNDSLPVVRFYTNGDYSRAEERGFMSPVTQISRVSKNSSYTLDASFKTAMKVTLAKPKITVNSMGDSLYVATSADAELRFQGGTKVIAGHLCKKAVLVVNVDQKQTKRFKIAIWYCPEPSQVYWDEYDYLQKIPGAPLAIIMDFRSGFGIVASSVTKGDLHQSQFEVPQDYKKVKGTF